MPTIYEILFLILFKIWVKLLTLIVSMLFTIFIGWPYVVLIWAYRIIKKMKKEKVI